MSDYETYGWETIVPVSGYWSVTAEYQYIYPDDLNPPAMNVNINPVIGFGRIAVVNHDMEDITYSWEPVVPDPREDPLINYYRSIDHEPGQRTARIVYDPTYQWSSDEDSLPAGITREELQEAIGPIKGSS